MCRGPLALTVVVVAALSGIFIISLADLVKIIANGHEPAGDSSPAQWFRSTLFYQISRQGLGRN